MKLRFLSQIDFLRSIKLFCTTMRQVNRPLEALFSKFPTEGTTPVVIPSLAVLAYQALWHGNTARPGTLKAVVQKIMNPFPKAILRETESLRQEWIVMCKKIFRVIRKIPNAMMIGGFIRDWFVRGEIPSDMDVKVRNIDDMTNLVFDLAKQFDVSWPNRPSATAVGYGAMKIRVVDRETRVGIWLDITLGEPNFDFAENSLTMVKWDKIIYPSWCQSLQLQFELIHNIKEKIMTPLNPSGRKSVVHSDESDCMFTDGFKARVEKFKARGWTILGLGECEVHGRCALACDDLKRGYVEKCALEERQYNERLKWLTKMRKKQELWDSIAKVVEEAKTHDVEIPSHKQLRQTKFDQRKRFQKTKSEKHKLRRSGKR